MGWKNSLHGRKVQYDNRMVYVNGRPVGNDEVGRGSTWYVDSAVDGSDGSSPDTALGTLDEAFAKCTANQGDKIVVMPNHAETVTGAGGITADVAGVTVVGLGTYNQRPRILMDGGTAVTVVVSAADVVFENIVFASGHADIVSCFDVQAKGCVLNAIEFADNTTDENWLTPIECSGTTNNECDGLTVVNCRWVSPDAGCLEFIEGNADIADLVVRDNFIVHEGTASPLVLMATGKDMQRCDIRDNFLSHKQTANELLINCDTAANSGIIAHNRVGHADVTTAHDLGIDSLGCRLFDNLSTSTDSASGFVLPAIDTDS